MSCRSLKRSTATSGSRRLRPFAVEVVDADGRPVPDADVIGDAIVASRFGEQREVVVRPDAETGSGQYVARWYPLRLYAHALHSGRGVSDIVRVDAYRPVVRLKLATKGRLRGRVADSDLEVVLSSPGRRVVKRRRE